MSPANILITGNTGYIGRALHRALAGKFNVFTSNSIDNNLSETKYWNLPKLCIIYHCACHARAGSYCLTHQSDYWIVNQKLNTAMIDYWVEKQPQAELHTFGTSCSYDPDSLHSEEYYLRGTPYPDLYYYAMTKRMLLIGLMAAKAQHGLKYKHFILPTVYGPGFSATDNHFVYDLIRKIVCYKRTGIPARLWGNGTQTRQLLFIEDLISAITSEKIEEDSINIAFDRARTIRDIASDIAFHLGTDDKSFTFDPSMYVGVKNRELVYNMVAKYGFSYTPLIEGLQKTIPHEKV